MYSLGTVSYTHLDVYKRQHINSKVKYEVKMIILLINNKYISTYLHVIVAANPLFLMCENHSEIVGGNIKEGSRAYNPPIR